jgi:hypothetical protein
VAAAPTPRNQYNWPVPSSLTWDSTLRTWINQRTTQITWIFREPYFAIKPALIPFSYWAPQLNVALLTTPPSGKPKNHTDWPLPIRAIEAARTWTQSPNFAAQVAPITLIPSQVVDWGTFDPIPPSPAWTAQSNVALHSTVQVTRPIGAQQCALPIQDSPRIYGSTFRNPFLAPKPVNQNSWPLPIAAQQGAITWTKAPNFAAQVAPMPPRGRQTALPILATPQIYGSTFRNPFLLNLPKNQYDWHLPILRTVEPVGWIQQSGLALHVTPPPSKPKNQTDWPLPIRAIAAHPSLYTVTNSPHPVEVVPPPAPPPKKIRKAKFVLRKVRAEDAVLYNQRVR